jgi:hypothetical protein
LRVLLRKEDVGDFELFTLLLPEPSKGTLIYRSLKRRKINADQDLSGDCHTGIWFIQALKRQHCALWKMMKYLWFDLKKEKRLNLSVYWK